MGEPTERDVEALTEAERGHAYEHFDEDDTHMGRCYLESDVERLLAERIAQARREGAAEALTDLLRHAHLHENKRSTVSGPFVPSVTLNELEAIVRVLRDDA